MVCFGVVELKRFFPKNLDDATDVFAGDSFCFSSPYTDHVYINFPNCL